MLRKTGMDEHDAADCLCEFMKECHVVPVEQFVNWMMRQQGGHEIEGAEVDRPMPANAWFLCFQCGMPLHSK